MLADACWCCWFCAGKYSGGEVPAGSRFALEQYKGLADKKLKEKKVTSGAMGWVQGRGQHPQQRRRGSS